MTVDARVPAPGCPPVTAAAGAGSMPANASTSAMAHKSDTGRASAEAVANCGARRTTALARRTTPSSPSQPQPLRRLQTVGIHELVVQRLEGLDRNARLLGDGRQRVTGLDHIELCARESSAAGRGRSAGDVRMRAG